MTAITRWIEYGVSAVGSYSNGDNAYKGTRGYTAATSSTYDVFTITAANNKLYFSIDGDDEYITLTSGTDIDARCVARDITEKIHNLGKNITDFDKAVCVYENNQLKLYSGSLGSGSSAVVTSGTNSAHLTLGWGTDSTAGGVAHTVSNTQATNAYTGILTVSGTYNGFFDEVYKIVINKEPNVGAPAKDGSNNYTGTLIARGAFKHTTNLTYTISIDCTNGTTMGGGTGNVPTITWTTTGGVDDSAAPLELLYANFWYRLGTKGAMVKFSDAVFNTCSPAFTIACTYPYYAEGTNATQMVGSAKYIWSSTRGDDVRDYGAGTAITTASGSFTPLGSRGLSISFSGGDGILTGGDVFYVLCSPPQPSTAGITNINYGNVTVSTESAVKCVIFEITSGAVELGAVKFGLQSHGTFSHHNAGLSDTKFRFGTVGPGNKAGSSPINGLEWRQNVTAANIATDIPYAFMYASKENLSVVGDADASESVGASTFCGMVADPIWLNIRLGASEVGANAAINYRVYFDYS